MGYSIELCYSLCVGDDFKISRTCRLDYIIYLFHIDQMGDGQKDEALISLAAPHLALREPQNLAVFVCCISFSSSLAPSLSPYVPLTAALSLYANLANVANVEVSLPVGTTSVHRPQLLCRDSVT